MAKTLELTLLKALYNSYALKTLSHQVFGEVDIDRFAEMIMPIIHIGERQLSYDTSPRSGPPVLFIQGVGVPGCGWTPQTDALRSNFGSHLLIIGELETAILEKIH